MYIYYICMYIYYIYMYIYYICMYIYYICMYVYIYHVSNTWHYSWWPGARTVREKHEDCGLIECIPVIDLVAFM